MIGKSHGQHSPPRSPKPCSPGNFLQRCLSVHTGFQVGPWDRVHIVNMLPRSSSHNYWANYRPLTCELTHPQVNLSVVVHPRRSWWGSRLRIPPNSNSSCSLCLHPRIPSLGFSWTPVKCGGLESIMDSVDMILSKFWEIVEDRGALCSALHWVTNSQAWLSDWLTIFKRWVRNDLNFSPGTLISSHMLLREKRIFVTLRDQTQPPPTPMHMEYHKG